MVAFIYVGVCWVTMRPGLWSKKHPRGISGRLASMTRTRAAMHALMHAQGPTCTLCVLSLCQLFV